MNLGNNNAGQNQAASTGMMSPIAGMNEVELKIDLADLANLSSSIKGLKELVPVASLKPEYKRFVSEGEKCRGAFLKFGKVPNGRGENLDSVFWIEEDGKTFYHSGIILVDVCRKNNLIKGAQIEIVYKGKKKQRTMDFDVKILGKPNG